MATLAAVVSGNGAQFPYGPSLTNKIAGRKPKKKKKAKPAAVTAQMPSYAQPGAQVDPASVPGYGQVAAPTAAAAAPAAPKLSAYEKRRQGILDIMNDPALAAYNEQYTPNYDAARSQIENAFAQAQGEIQSRQAAGEGLLATMPGQIDANYGGAAAQINTMAAGNAQAQQDSGLKQFGNENAGLAPVQAGLAMEQAGAKSQVPTLGVGLNNLVSEQRQAIGTDRANALADISQKEEEARAAAAQQANEPSWAQQQLIQAELADEDAKAAKKKDHYEWGTDTISGSRGEYVANKLPRLTARLRSGSGPKDGQAAYDMVRKGLNGLAGMGPNKQKSAMAKLLAQARKKYPGAMKAISLAVYEVLGA